MIKAPPPLGYLGSLDPEVQVLDPDVDRLRRVTISKNRRVTIFFFVEDVDSSSSTKSFLFFFAV